MSKFGLSIERKLYLDANADDFFVNLAYNMDNPRFGSIVLDLFSTKHTKYKGLINSHSFRFKFKTQLEQISLNYPVIIGTYAQMDNKLFVDIKVTCITTYLKILFAQFSMVVLLLTAIISKVANDYTDVLVLSMMSLSVLLFITLPEIYRMRKGVKLATEEVIKDFQKIKSNQ